MTRQRRHLLAQPGPDTGDAGAGPALSLVVRRWCSLCDAMRDEAAPIAARHGFGIVDVDLDAHPEWESRFGERVPVLLLGPAPDGEVLASLALDAADLDRALARMPVAGAREIR